MNISDASAVLENYLTVAWTATPIAYENVEARNWSEIGQPLLPDGDSDYIAIRSQVVNSRTLTVPGTCRRYEGVLFVGVAVRDGTGTRVADTYAAQLVTLLEGKELPSTTGMLRLWNLGGSVKYRPTTGWYVNELSFSFSFERYT